MSNYRILKIPGETEEDTYYTIQKKKYFITDMRTTFFGFKQLYQEDYTWEDITTYIGEHMSMEIFEIKEYTNIDNTVKAIFEFIEEDERME